MAQAADPLALAARARRSYVEGLLNGINGVAQGVLEGARALAGQTAEPAVQYKRRDAFLDLQKAAPAWLTGMARL